MTNTGDSVAVSIVIPTYNEQENILGLLEQIATALQDVRMEVLVVDDDSPDGTGRVVAEAARRRPWLRVVHRHARASLSGSVLDGLRQARGQALCVMDADLSHDPALLPNMVEAVRQGNDLVIASRWMSGGSVEGWSCWRRGLSRMGTWLARTLLRLPITDPLSGYFAMDRRFYARTAPLVHSCGFKILLTFYVRGQPQTVEELAYRFRDRTHGRSKLTLTAGWHYVMTLATLTAFRWGGSASRRPRREDS